LQPCGRKNRALIELYVTVLIIYAFGKLRLASQQNLCDQFSTRQVEELLAFLLLKPKIRHPREKLIAMLWPELDVPHARHRFSIALSRLRRAVRSLGVKFEDYFQTTNDWVAFMPKQPYQFDRDLFVQSFRQALQTDDLIQKEAVLGEALAIFRNHLMEGIYADWCLAEREYLERLRLRALGLAMHCCMQRQAYEDAIEFGYDILHHDPLREEVHCALMHCFHAQQRADLLLRQYKKCRELLQAELRQPPSPGTTALFQKLMADLAKVRLDETTDFKTRQKLILAMNTFLQAADQLQKLLVYGK